jgi:hypothetical protein
LVHEMRLGTRQAPDTLCPVKVGVVATGGTIAGLIEHNVVANRDGPSVDSEAGAPELALLKRLIQTLCAGAALILLTLMMAPTVAGASSAVPLRTWGADCGAMVCPAPPVNGGGPVVSNSVVDVVLIGQWTPANSPNTRHGYLPWVRVAGGGSSASTGWGK